MELTFSPLNSNSVVSAARLPGPAARSFSPPLPLFPILSRISQPFSASKSTVCCESRQAKKRLAGRALAVKYSFLLQSWKVKSRISLRATGFGNTSDVSDESASDHVSIITQVDDQRMDELIQVFLFEKPSPTDWRTALILSRQWDTIAPDFYKRCQDRADSESDPAMKLQLLRLARKLKEIDNDVQKNNELVDAIRKSPTEVHEIVSRRRKDFTKEFFEHFHTVGDSYYDNLAEQNEILRLKRACLAAVLAYDAADAMGAQNAGQLNIQDIINSPSASTAAASQLDLTKNAGQLNIQDIINSPSVSAPSPQIGISADKNQFGSALDLINIKAWAGTKETSMMKEEVQDTMFHFYKTAVRNAQRLVPKDVRILKYLLQIENPERLMSALKDAFTPGEEVEGTFSLVTANQNKFHEVVVKPNSECMNFQLEFRKCKGTLKLIFLTFPFTFSVVSAQNFSGVRQSSLQKMITANTRKTITCVVCESSNLASICPVCVNCRLNEYNCNLRLLKSKRDALYSRLTQVLVAKGKADDQQSWRVLQHEKLASLRDKLQLRKEQVSQGKAKIGKMSHDLKVKYELLESAMNMLERNRVEQIEKYYPNLICTQSLGHFTIALLQELKGQFDTICNARLPKGLDPHSVPSDELAASLGYMVQLLNLVVPTVCAPALHNSGFAGSCSRIWQRESYWDARPSSRSEFPLFIPRQNFCTTGGETSWSERSSSNFGVASMESERRPRLESSGGSFNYSSASPHSIETHKDLQKGISLLKKSVACITAYCYNSLSLEVPLEASTFEAFARLLATLSSSKEVRAVLSLRTAASRSSKPNQQLSTSVWNVESAISSSTLMESAHAQPILRNASDNYLPSSAASYLFPNELSDMKNENLIDGWDLVEHPTFPPPPSQTEDVEHWTRAMILDATKR
ncbi:DNA-directed RNA polymerase II [Striga asiatica]|uniref:DNA-directed RNA polymerase II n=1 Tax=Striga asiatica TaxID=4170 RepID=A0A5A7QTY6_STRAF|nr:DNA-directed RNA polymerase II [Striga asiatica]